MTTNPTPEQVAARRKAVREMHAAGRTQEQIADALGCSLATVKRDEKALGIKRAELAAAYRRRVIERIRRTKQAATLDYQGVPVEDIAERMGLGLSTVHRYLRSDIAADVRRNLALKAEREVALPPGRWVPVRRNGLVVQVYVEEGAGVKSDDPRHGSVAGHHAHSSSGQADCEPCREAWNRYQRDRRTRHYIKRSPLVVDGTGARRRLRALAALGWTLNQLDAQLGFKRDRCQEFIRRDGDMLLSNVEKIAALYDQLCMTAPEGWVADRARRMARTKGWPPPLAWEDIDDLAEQPAKVVRRDWHKVANDDVDEVVVERLLALQRVKATRAEKEEAMRRWLNDGGSEKDLCDAHGWRSGRYTSKRQEDAA